MPGHDFAGLRTELLDAGLPPDLPAAIVSRATALDQRHHFSTLGELDKLPRVESPAILLIGWTLDRARQRLNGESISDALDEPALLLSSL
jgi:siroheme synthase